MGTTLQHAMDTFNKRDILACQMERIIAQLKLKPAEEYNLQICARKVGRSDVFQLLSGEECNRGDVEIGGYATSKQAELLKLLTGDFGKKNAPVKFNLSGDKLSTCLNLSELDWSVLKQITKLFL